MGVYDRTEKKSIAPGLRLSGKDIPRDEKYHFYHLGTARLGPDSVVWAHGTWLLTCVLDKAYQLADGIDPSINDWDVYVSLKFTGPSYVEGSENEDAVWMDRVILARPEAGKG